MGLVALERALPAADAPATVAITQVAVVDPHAGTVLRDQSVVIRGRRIVAVGPSRRTPPPARARIVDGRGRYLIPGLWDMHVHLAARGGPPREPGDRRTYAFGLLLANGVTGVRDMGGELPLAAAWRDSVARGQLLGPAMLVTGRKLGVEAVTDGAPHPLRTADDVRRAIRLLREGGADHVKMGDMPPALFDVALAAAREAGLPVGGHVPLGMSARTAALGGMHSIEHLHAVVTAGSPRERDLLEDQLARVRMARWRERLLERVTGRRPAFPMPRPDEIEDERLVALGRLARSHDTWVTPTLRLHAATLGQRGPLLTLGPAAWRRDARGVADWESRTPSDAERAEWTGMRGALAPLRRGGARILAGTDLPAPGAVPGFSLHDELAMMVAVGLTPAEALESATWAPAAYLGALDSLGAVAAGRIADLVLLDGNPLEDVEQTRQVHAVLVRGRVLDRTDLDSLLEGAAAVAARWRSGTAAGGIAAAPRP